MGEAKRRPYSRAAGLIMPAVQSNAKDEVMAKSVRVPEGYTHVAPVNVKEVGVTFVACAEDRDPIVYNPRSKEWCQFRLAGGQNGLVLP